jgi:hypothetical protein
MVYEKYLLRVKYIRIKHINMTYGHVRRRPRNHVEYKVRPEGSIIAALNNAQSAVAVPQKVDEQQLTFSTYYFLS